MKRPFVVIAIAWLAGALLAFNDRKYWLVMCFIIWLVMVLWVPERLSISRKSGLLIGVIFICSVCYNVVFDMHNVSRIEAHYDQQQRFFQGVIISTLTVDGDQASFVWRTIEGERLQVYIRLASEDEQQIVQRWGRGDQLTMSGTLQRPQSARNFDGFDYANHLYYERIHWILQVQGLERVDWNLSSSWQLIQVLRWTDNMREALGETIDVLFSRQSSGFMKSVLIGLRDDLTPEQFDHFARTGLTHIMAISGLHVGIFVAGCLAVGRLCRLTREMNAHLVTWLIPCYVMMAGAAPSAVRAGCMAMIALYAWRRGLLKDGLSIISIVAMIMLIARPYYLYQISFQLSFIVTIGLVVFVPKLHQLIPLRAVQLKGMTAVTTAATLTSFPLTIYYFNQFSLLSWLANLFIVPIVSVFVIPLGMITLLLAHLSMSVAHWFAQLINIVYDYLLYVIELMSKMQVMQTIWASPSIIWIAMYYSLITVVIFNLSPLSMHTLRVIKWRVAIVALCALLFFGYYPQWFERQGVVQFIDVGQGDAILIRTPQGKTILIDGGGTLRFTKPGDEWKQRSEPYEVGKNLLVPLLKKRGIHHIDYCIVTHADQDHYGGLQAVLNHFPVRHFIFNGVLKQDEAYEALLHTVLSNQTPIYVAHDGKVIDIDRHTTLSFMYPFPSPVVHHVQRQNDWSLVMLLKMYDSQFLLTGDIEMQAEREILYTVKDSPSPSIDVMKVAHHGSRTSTSDDWLNYWQPRIAIIPVGRNNTYGHPHPTVVERLRSRQIATWRTDLHGEIQFLVSDKQLQMRAMLDNR